jgi:hypothetical protein
MKPLEMKAPQRVAGGPAEASVPTLADMRRAARLQEIRAEMSALLNLLSKPPAGPAKESKIQTMRPRLAAEPSRTRQLSLDGELF